MPWLRDASLDLFLGGRCVGCDRPGRVWCARCAAAASGPPYLAWPTPTPPGLVPPWAAGEYAGVLRAAILAHKEQAVHALRFPLARLLADAVAAAVPGDAAVLLVPVPSRRAATRARGHDPTRRLVRTAASILRREGRPAQQAPLLGIRGAVADQSGLDTPARAANLAGSLRLRPGVLRGRIALGPGAVVVCDDILTTGATAREAQRALEHDGLAVRAIATVAATTKLGGLLPSSVRVG